MLKAKNLLVIGLLAFSLTACAKKPEGIVTHGENIEDGDMALIMDETEGQKAPLTRPDEQFRVKLTIGLVKNDVAAVTLASLAKENEEDAAFEKYEFVYGENYTALAEMLKTGKVGVALMPPTKALEMYAGDKNVKVLAALTGKSGKLVGNISSLSDLEGKTVHISGDDKSALGIMTKLVNYAGVKNCTFEQVADNNTLYNLIKQGKTDCAFITEPYVAMLKQEGVAVNEYNFTQDWENATGGQSYCLGTVVIGTDYLSRYKSVVDYMLDDMERSVNAAKDHADTSGDAAGQLGLADNSKAIADAYTAMDIGFYKNKQMRYLVDSMFTALDEAEGDVLGVQLPDEEFYLVKKH